MISDDGNQYRIRQKYSTLQKVLSSKTHSEKRKYRKNWDSSLSTRSKHSKGSKSENKTSLGIRWGRFHPEFFMADHGGHQHKSPPFSIGDTSNIQILHTANPSHSNHKSRHANHVTQSFRGIVHSKKVLIKIGGRRNGSYLWSDQI